MKGFRLGIRADEIPPILVGALRPGMLRLAGREGDGAIINWLSADDVKTVVPHVGEGKEIVARIVPPTDNEEAVRFIGKRHRRLPQRPGLRRVSRLARPGRDVPADVGRMEGRRPRGRDRGHPRRSSSTR